MADLIGLAVAAIGAIGAGATALRSPRLCLGILFLTASASRLTVETIVGTMRPEQPAIVVVASVLLVSGRWRVLRTLPRSVFGIGLCFGLYLAAQALAAVFVAPDPAASLRLTLWLAVSMAAGVVALVLALPVATQTGPAFAVAGSVNAVIGLATAVLFLALGPNFDIGVQEIWSTSPRVYAVTWETNLFASLLAICAPFAIEEFRASPRRSTGLLALLILAAMPLGSTRGAYIGLAAGLLSYGALLFVSGTRLSTLRLPSAAAASALVVGVVAAGVLLPNPLERYLNDVGTPGPSVTPIASPGSSVAGTPEPTAAPTPPPSLAPLTDTLAFRLDRIPVAFDDFRTSPWIGLGPGSFGQLHKDRSQEGDPDHIAILAVAVPHDSGLIGTAGLVAATGWLLLGLFRRARRAGPREVGISAAFVASIATLLVAYQATNALHFALNWIVVGAAVALLARPVDPRPSSGDGRDPALYSTR